MMEIVKAAVREFAHSRSLNPPKTEAVMLSGTCKNCGCEVRCRANDSEVTSSIFGGYRVKCPTTAMSPAIVYRCDHWIYLKKPKKPNDGFCGSDWLP